MGQRGRFLLNKVAYSMPWKNNIFDLIDKKNLFFKYKLITNLLEITIRNNFFIFF